MSTVADLRDRLRGCISGREKQLDSLNRMQWDVESSNKAIEQLQKEISVLTAAGIK